MGVYWAISWLMGWGVIACLDLYGVTSLFGLAAQAAGACASVTSGEKIVGGEDSKDRRAGRWSVPEPCSNHLCRIGLICKEGGTEIWSVGGTGVQQAVTTNHAI